jgi:hypothetical protein
VSRKPSSLAVVPDPVDAAAPPLTVERPSDPADDARVAYEEAELRARALRKKWEDMDCPVLTNGSMGQTIAHPMLRMIENAERHASKLREALNAKRGPGRPPKGVVTASIGKSPAQALREQK